MIYKNRHKLTQQNKNKALGISLYTKYTNVLVWGGGEKQFIHLRELEKGYTSKSWKSYRKSRMIQQ